MTAAKKDSQAERLIALETIINSLSEDIKSVAEAVKEVADANHAALQDMRAASAKRESADRSRTLSVVAIIVTVMLPVFGLIGMTLSELNDDVGQIRDFRVEDAYERGRIAGKSEERALRLNRVESQMDSLLQRPKEN